MFSGKRQFELYCHWFATSAAFTGKTAALPTAQASGNGRRGPLVTRRKL